MGSNHSLIALVMGQQPKEEMVGDAMVRGVVKVTLR
ncbi:hypothetical protein E2C01_093042 [Portunus trituberculatus]|uniref:Uncharacterized protein n=1 Tax=Portunus trituberculatus TaxID=210409 RepID=A0A5B7JSZ9_PORTR|nr:hypothetical protein [Portunus trituberculatus]